MKKLLISCGLALILLLSAVSPVLAASISIQWVKYDFDAPENEPALSVKWTHRDKPFDVTAGEFQLQGPPLRETTIAEVEARIQEKFNDLLVEDVKLSTIDADDPVRQDPPELLWPDEEIVVIHNSEYLRTHKAFFAIHIYSLDDLETPESELSFTTVFSIYPIEPDWW